MRTAFLFALPAVAAAAAALDSSSKTEQAAAPAAAVLPAIFPIITAAPPNPLEKRCSHSAPCSDFSEPSECESALDSILDKLPPLTASASLSLASWTSAHLYELEPQRPIADVSDIAKGCAGFDGYGWNPAVSPTGRDTTLSAQWTEWRSSLRAFKTDNADEARRWATKCGPGEVSGLFEQVAATDPAGCERVYSERFSLAGKVGSPTTAGVTVSTSEEASKVSSTLSTGGVTVGTGGKSTSATVGVSSSLSAGGGAAGPRETGRAVAVLAFVGAVGVAMGL
ncbi:hypothetical protein QBC43DRAFT_349451 [Cladorrhinum sp. PSN259]|nr:hypothetical protein QBC43DRAFT_349451 [Cladorrhinum sp. PSN259]